MKAPPCFRTRGVCAGILLMLLILPALRSFSQTEKKLVWKNANGKEITASFVKLEDGKVHLRKPDGSVAEVPLTSLSWESGRQAIALKWQLLGMGDLRLAVPDHAGVSESFVKLTRVPEVEAAPKGWFRYRCANFEFDSQTELDSKFVAQTGRVFESTRELLKRLPWRIEAIPEKGPRFRALIYRDLKAYQDGGAPPGSGGVFKPSTGEFSLPLTSANSTDTMQHELTHQMMQRLLSVIPWWIAEGTAEYVTIMKYRDGYYDCKMVSKRQVVPELQRRGPYCTDDAFLHALEYRSQTQAEMVLGSMLDGTNRHQNSIRQIRQKEFERLKATLAACEERKQLYVKMFALEADQALTLPVQEPPAAAKPAARPDIARMRTETSTSSLVTPGGLTQVNLYAGSTLMVYYLTSLAPDQGESFARYMWSAQQLRDEFDLSMKLLEIDASEYRKKMEALQEESGAVEKAVSAGVKEFEAYFDAAEKYASNCGRRNEVTTGQFEFVHKPDSRFKPPVPPEVPVIKFPELPSPPAPRLTAAEVQKRQSELLKTLMKNRNPLDFINDVKEAAEKIGVHCGR